MKKIISIITLSLLLLLTVSFTVKAENIYYVPEDETRTDFYGSIIEETEEYVTVRYNFSNYIDDIFDLSVMERFISVSHFDPYYNDTGPYSFQTYFGQVPTYSDPDIIWQPFTVNFYYDSETDSYKFPNNTFITYDLRVFNFIVNGLNMEELIPVSTQIKSSMSSYLSMQNKSLHSHIEYNPLITFETDDLLSHLDRKEKNDYYISFDSEEWVNVFIDLDISYDLSGASYYLPNNNPEDYSNYGKIQLFENTNSYIEISYLKYNENSTNPTPDDLINRFDYDYSQIEFSSSIKDISKIESLNPSLRLFELTYNENIYQNKFKFAFPEEVNQSFITPSKLKLVNASGNLLLIYKQDERITYEFNLDTLEYKKFDKLKTVGFTSAGDNNQAYLTMFLPKTTDLLLSVDLTYQYRLKELFLGYQDWEIVNKVYNYYENPDGFFGQEVSMTEINSYRRDYVYMPFVALIRDMTDYYDDQTIQRISFTNMDQSIKEQFLEYFDVNTDSFSNYTYWQISLGQFRTITSVGFDIKDMTIIELTYMTDGDIYTFDFEEIDQEISDYETNNPDVFDYYNTFSRAVSGIFDDIKNFGSSIFAKTTSMFFGIGFMILAFVVLTWVIKRKMNPGRVNYRKRK